MLKVFLYTCTEYEYMWEASKKVDKNLTCPIYFGQACTSSKLNMFPTQPVAGMREGDRWGCPSKYGIGM